MAECLELCLICCEGDGCGDCFGSCCDGLVNCGDDCCLNTGDALCCEPSVSAADVAFIGDSAPPIIPIAPTTIIHTQPTAVPDISPVAFVHPIPTREVHASKCCDCCSGCSCSGSWPSLKTLGTWLAALAVLAALGVTLWLTNSIPFGTNCGNAHRSLLAVLLVVVVGGVIMPLYYKYVQRDVRQKDVFGRWENEALLPIRDVLRNYRKSSVLASKRFSFALKIMTLVLFVLVVVGFYYLWGRDNHCTDPKLWIVKAWFIALLVVAIIVTSVMIAAMIRAAKEKKLLRASSLKSSAIEMDANEGPTHTHSILPTKLPSPPFDTATDRPPSYPEFPVARAAFTSGSKDMPEATKEKSDYLTVQAEQVEQAEQQQRQQMHASHSQAAYGPSGTGAYC